MVLDHTQLIADAEDELFHLVEQRDAIDARIRQLNKILRGLASTLPTDAKRILLERLKTVSRKPAGLTEVIGDALRDNGGWMSTEEIREHLENSGFDLSEYSQASATLYNTLTRLKDSKRVERRFMRVPNQTTSVVKWHWIGG